MKFRQYLAKFENESSVAGDLARDVARDPDAPDEFAALRTYLAQRAPEEAVEALDDVHAQFAAKQQ